MAKQKCVAMLLAGGKGSRLKELTENLAKPAVPFGGKYRIIDFPLSNCANSGIHTVGVLTQYQPLVLNSYIGIGSAWDLDRKNGGVTVLPPYSESSEVKWYSGTASAIYQNLNYIKQYDPEYVLILSGDHIYKMNYDTMLDYHIEKQADVTISVIEVPWEEASRFGIMNTDADFNVTRFDEKPEKPESNLASMGIYIFKWSVLQKYLEMDESNPDSSNDFGKDVIPAMLADNLKLIAYPFKGYWKDVGTVKSLWEANMDLLDEKQDLNLFEYSWRIYSVNPNQPPQIIGSKAKVQHSLVNEGCIIDGVIEQSVMFQGVEVEEEAVLKECVVMPNARIGRGSYIERAIVMGDLEIPENTVIRNDSNDILLVTEQFLMEHTEQQSKVEEA
ncbi:glucose-1-phosphate adenylyltransferase [Domibacillus sp. DTU_2020_1001157_1_SI_ALB_TIR_016]|uniref:glucose-1-phosphate adenylyltransferase n=1 Tax=Domibacillus sp. DTU_2020_1001157_1_SI_ALB_TIR_016 TaxID=3077789 RepID=UPI0028F1501E|nr:glucose-1-phosphate adenylyltransferase [Domibacillus sp. DTU_2020_1001157_1_SI_ALB_TIR_016]WNS81660.1 glucose-1-phosphate adenylyltransferase [Domibacillus sp. DTU_2020_1001157_1_SI_ALB_TIR_016]